MRDLATWLLPGGCRLACLPGLSPLNPRETSSSSHVEPPVPALLQSRRCWQASRRPRAHCPFPLLETPRLSALRLTTYYQGPGCLSLKGRTVFTTQLPGIMGRHPNLHSHQWRRVMECSERAYILTRNVRGLLTAGLEPVRWLG